MKLKDKIKNLPCLPGIYIFKNKVKDIIYIGKSTNILNRVASYFLKSNILKSIKVRILNQHIYDIDYIVTSSENEALLLEDIYIKKYSPVFNSLLKDGKSYPFLEITVNENYPRIIKSYSFNISPLSKVYGPYTNISMVDKFIDLLYYIYPIRSCDFVIPSKKKIDPCIDFYIDKCKGCCIDKISSVIYKKYITEIVNSLDNFNFSPFYNILFQKLSDSNGNKIKIKDIIEKIDFLSKMSKEYIMQFVVMSLKVNIDFWGCVYSDDLFVICVISINRGKIYNKKVFKYINKNNISLTLNFEEFLYDSVKKFYNINEIPNKCFFSYKYIVLDNIQDILLNCEVNTIKQDTNFKYKKVMDLSLSNAKIIYHNEAIFLNIASKALNSLKDILNLKSIPYIIEGFDISHTSGYQTVASMVYFKNGIPVNKNYRYFNIKLYSNNDVMSLYEATYRRYSRILREGGDFPNLILIDGGKPQVNSVYNVLLKLKLNIPLISLAKKEEYIYLPNNSQPIILDHSSESLKLLQKIRDEAHRFANKKHKNRRQKVIIDNKILKINGIGDKRYKNIMKFINYDITKLYNISKDELLKIDGINKKTALNIIKYFQ